MSYARRMWPAFETYHAHIYFVPEAAEAYRRLGLKGGWMGYFASRSAPLGAASPELVTAVFFNFHPAMVARALPDAWVLASPEDVIAALVGGLVVAVWYLAVDLGSGNLLHTPSVLGQVFVGGDTVPTVQQVVPGAVAQYSLLHFAIFLLVGTALVALTHMATRNPGLRMGVWIGLVVGFLFFLGFLLMLYSATDQRFPWWPALIGSILGFGSMALLLWRRHPGLRGTFDRAPLGDEVKPPPHPPQRFHR